MTTSINTLFGEYWAIDKMMLCLFAPFNESLKIVCDHFDTLVLYSEETPDGLKEVGGQLMLHMMENSITKDYTKFDTIEDPQPSADLTEMNVPMRVMWGTNDTLCPQTNQQEFVERVQKLGRQFEFEEDHFYFS